MAPLLSGCLNLEKSEFLFSHLCNEFTNCLTHSDTVRIQLDSCHLIVLHWNYTGMIFSSIFNYVSLTSLGRTT